LIGAHGNKNAVQIAAQQLEGAIQLRLALNFERRLVALHALARAAGENETVYWLRGHGATA